MKKEDYDSKDPNQKRLASKLHKENRVWDFPLTPNEVW